MLVTIGAIALFASVAHARRERGALERYDLKTLVVSFISAPRPDGSRYAYIRDPENYVHRVEAGDYLGKAAGKITEIRAREILFTELVKKNGKLVEQPSTLACGIPCRNN